MIKKVFTTSLMVIFIPLLTACESGKIVTSTSAMGQRIDNLKKYAPPSYSSGNTKKSSGSVIYLGREYENNTFGPAGIRFVFD